MKKTFIKFIFLFLLSWASFAFAVTKIDSEVARLEQSVFGVNYPNDSNEKRIERLELQVLGKTNTKLDIEKRAEKLTKALGLETYEESKSDIADLYVQEKEGKRCQTEKTFCHGAWRNQL